MGRREAGCMLLIHCPNLFHTAICYQSRSEETDILHAGLGCSWHRVAPGSVAADEWRRKSRCCGHCCVASL